MKCQICGSNKVSLVEEPIVRMGVTILMHGERCKACGEVSVSDAEAARQEKEIASMLATRGVRKGVELKLVRKVAGLLAAELAELLDVRPETVSRWERDETPIPRTTAYVIRDLLEQPKRTRDRLQALAAG